VKLAEQWNRAYSALDPNWREARLLLQVSDAARAERAVALLGPGNPGRSGNSIRFRAVRDGSGLGPEAVRRILRRLDDEAIAGALDVVAADGGAQPSASGRVTRRAVADLWDAELAKLPSDWSDLWCELRLTSSDHLEHAALLCAPLNPLRVADTLNYTFRCARTFGYGTSPGMVRRCFEQLDDEGIPAHVVVLRALSDTHPAGTQGPVWYVAGRTV
jgi:hypothetical protein